MTSTNTPASCGNVCAAFRSNVAIDSNIEKPRTTSQSGLRVPTCAMQFLGEARVEDVLSEPLYSGERPQNPADAGARLRLMRPPGGAPIAQLVTPTSRSLYLNLLVHWAGKEGNIFTVVLLTPQSDTSPVFTVLRVPSPDDCQKIIHILNPEKPAEEGGRPLSVASNAGSSSFEPALSEAPDNNATVNAVLDSITSRLAEMVCLEVARQMEEMHPDAQQPAPAESPLAPPPFETASRRSDRSTLLKLASRLVCPALDLVDRAAAYATSLTAALRARLA